MPYYDLKCSCCGSNLNIKASIKEREEKSIKCPQCASTDLETIFSNVNIVKSRPASPQCPNTSKCGGCSYMQ